MADILKYQSHEVLNKVLNSAETALQVDIVSGAEYAEDSAHTDTDTGNFILGVRNDTLAALGGTDGDYVPFQMNSSGALFVEVASSSGDDSIYVDDANWTDSTSKHTLVGGLYQSSPQTITDGDVGPLQVNSSGNLIVDLSATDNAVLDAMVVDLAALEVLSIAANVDHAANEVLLGTIDADTGSIKTAVEIIDNAISGSEMQVDVVASLPSGSNTIGVVDLGSTDNAVLDAIATDGDNIQTLLSTLDGVQDSALTKLGEIETTNNANQVLLGTIDADTNAMKIDLAALEVLQASTNTKLDTLETTLTAIETDDAAIEVLLAAANTDHAANEVLLGTIDSDTNETKTALNKMLYGTGLAVTAVHGGSDHTLGATYEAFFIGVGGDISLDMGTSGTNIVFKNLASGQMLPVQATVVNATNTTATNIVALKA